MEALTALYQTAKDSPGQFAHVAARLRATRAERDAKAAFTAGLEAQGFAIYGDRSYVPWTLALDNLRDDDGNQISPEAHTTCPGRAVAIIYEWDWAPEAETAYRAAHALADEDDLADVEFADDEEARAAGFVPGWRVGRHLCTDPQAYGTATCTAYPDRRRPRSSKPPKARPPRPPAKLKNAAGSGSGTPRGGPPPTPARPISRRC